MTPALSLLCSLHLSTVVGALAVAVNSSWPLLRHRKRILAVQAVGSSLFGIHFLLIGSSTAAAMCAAGIVQGVTAAVVARRGVRLGIVGATLLAGAAVTVLTWHGLPSAFAQAGGLFSASGRLQRDTQRLRWLFLGSEMCWTTHNLMVGSPWGLTSDTLAITMLTAGLWRGYRARMAVPTDLVATPAAALASV